MRRLTKKEAEDHFGVSPSTLDRMIERGDVEIEREPHGTRHRVFVVVHDEASDSSDDEFSDLSPEAQLAVAKERVKGLEQVVERQRSDLNDSEWRYQQLVQPLKASQDTVDRLTQRMLPPSEAEGQKRSWWRFW